MIQEAGRRCPRGSHGNTRGLESKSPRLSLQKIGEAREAPRTFFVASPPYSFNNNQLPIPPITHLPTSYPPTISRGSSELETKEKKVL